MKQVQAVVYHPEHTLKKERFSPYAHLHLTFVVCFIYVYVNLTIHPLDLGLPGIADLVEAFLLSWIK